jgi:hypothetical protein
MLHSQPRWKLLPPFQPQDLRQVQNPVRHRKTEQPLQQQALPRFHRP